MRYLLNAFLLLALIPMLTSASDWQPDILGGPYEMRYVDQGTDYSGPVRSTIVRLSPDPSDCSDCPDCSNHSHRGILYVHGFNDYFLQKDMGERLADSCWRFYAVDLRKYGRSLEEGQRLFEVRDMHEYFADIDSAVAQMKRDGIDTIVLMGHSTGGLTTSLYLNNRPDSAIKGLILNSPFLDWNQSKFQERVLIPLVNCFGGHFPGMKALSGSTPYYHRPDTLKGEGEWDIIRAWKPRQWPALTAGWIHAIDEGHDELRPGGGNRGAGSQIKVPVLLMHSDRTYNKNMPDAYRDSTDDVLDVADIFRYGRTLGPDVREVTIHNGVHDLVRSAPEPREKTYDAIFNYLRSL